MEVEVSDNPWRNMMLLSVCLTLQHCFPFFLLDIALHSLQNLAFLCLAGSQLEVFSLLNHIMNLPSLLQILL